MTSRRSDYIIVTFCITTCLLVDLTRCLRFTVEPDDQIVVIDTPLWWNCAATDEDQITYSWSKNGNSLPVHENLMVLGNGTLHVRKISADDVGVYTCKAETPSGPILQSRESTLQLAYIDPSFTLQPRSKTVLLGDDVNITCQIGSLPAANITWLLNGEPVTLNTATATQDDKGESTLAVSLMMYYGAGEYKCLGTNPLLNVYRYSLGADIVVQGPPVFLVSLETVSMPLGFKAIFNCYFHGNPKPGLTWFIHITGGDGQLSTRELLNSAKHNIFPNGTLIVHDITDADQAFYTCSVNNSYGQMSESAELIVTGEATLPSFILTPQNVTVNTGDNITILCNASGNPEPGIFWLQDNIVLHTNEGLIVADGQITLVDIQSDQSGVYWCMATNEVGSVNSSFYVNVQVIPSFTTSPMDTTSLIGESITLNCQASGNPVPSISWTSPQYGEIFLSSNMLGIKLYTDGMLVVSAASFRDGGIYTCTARNVVGYKQMFATIKIESPPEFTFLPVSQSLNQGGTVYFHCQSSGIPTPTFVWSKDGEGEITSSPQRQIYLNHTLVIRSVNVADEGIYRCTASNRHNSVLAVATLTVTVLPSFVVLPENQTVYIGSRVELQCDSTGSPVPSQVWRKDGANLFTDDNLYVSADSSQLIIENIKESQFGEYTCTSVNMAGDRSVSVWIKQFDVPVITVYPQNATVNQSESVTLTCQGQAKTEIPSVVWYKQESGKINEIISNNRVTVNEDGNLKIQNVEPGDEGWYRCVLSNSAGSVFTQVFVNVNVLPTILHTNSPQTTVHQSSVILSCQSIGDPQPTLEWFNPSGNKISASSSHLIGSDSLEIVSANQNTDAGDWICQSCNIVGCVDSVIHLFVDGLPLIDSFRAYKTGDTIKLECKGKGQPFPTVTFSSKGQPITGGLKGHSLQNNVLSVEQADLRKEYTCKTSNKYGQDSITLSVPGKITPPSVVNIGSSWVTLQLTPSNSLSDLPLTSYSVQMTSNGGRTWQNVPLTEPVVSKSANISSLSPHEGYSFRVAAGNILGFGMFGDMSKAVLTLPDAPSPPTNLLALEIDENTVLFSWSPSQFMNGDRADVAYRYTVKEKDSDTVYMSDTIYQNGTLQVEVHDIKTSGLYVFTVKAVNIVIGKSSNSINFTVDLSVPSTATAVPQTQTSGPSQPIIILVAVIGGILFILIIIFIALRIRRHRKTESLSFIKPRSSLDQFYMENPKQLYGSENRLSMRRSRSGNSFYSFTHDDSFHANGSSVRDSNGFSPSKRKSDGDVLLVAKNPLYTENTVGFSADSSRVNSPEPLLFDSLQQSGFQNEIELPPSDWISSYSAGSRPNSLHSGRTGSQTTNSGESNKKKPLTPLSAKSLEDDINAIYSSMNALVKPEKDQSLEHVYASIHSDGQSSRSLDLSLSSSNTDRNSNPNQPKPPIRVLSPDKLRVSPSRVNVDIETKKSSRSISPKRSKSKSRSASPMLSSSPKPPTRVLCVEQLRSSSGKECGEQEHLIKYDDIDVVVDDSEAVVNDIKAVISMGNGPESDKSPDIYCETHDGEDETLNGLNGETCNDPLIIATMENGHQSKTIDEDETISTHDKHITPLSDDAGEFLLAVKDDKSSAWRSKMDDNFLTDEQIKKEVISAELY